MSFYARLAALVFIVLTVAACWWKFEHALQVREARGYERALQESQALADKQALRNRALQRAAEKRYTVQAEVRERFIVQTVKEVTRETANLAACVLTPGARRLLDDAAACAGEDRPAACGAD